MTFGSIFDAPKLRAQLTEIEKKVADPNLWSDPENSQRVMRERKRLEEAIATEADLARRNDDVNAYFELAREGENVSAELRKEIDSLKGVVETLETRTLLSGPNDERNAIVTIHPGAGGTESQDWAEMLLRMYLRWAERRGFKRDIVDLQPGEDAGIKGATMTVTGEHAFGLLSAEAGVHHDGPPGPEHPARSPAHDSRRRPRGRLGVRRGRARQLYGWHAADHHHPLHGYAARPGGDA